ncbi:glycosyltransferase family 2 protein [Anoxybacillus suryakundensis]|uniref:Glycosyltransferase, GT2 family n=1 Tax=Anoxybacillus suryakundensis TaxID=1325335 RepID=A0A0K6GLP4_9BACL|nr:glycosyltransferase family 2 protein [Anoxybacillus suryakundensis]CUA79615.1 Glycosyltransferase, GT2 family [Anoxybacillus suryakundensis]
MNNYERVCVVLVTFNRKDLLIECLEHLKKQTRAVDGVYIVDNASSDGTPDLLLEKGYINDLTKEGTESFVEYPYEKGILKVYYVRMSDNLGGAGGFHEGVKRALSKGFDWLWLMDDDVKPLEDCLENLLKYKDRADALMPLRKTLDGEMLGIESIRMNFKNPFASMNGKKIKEVYTSADDIPREGVSIGAVPFEGPLIRTQLIKKIGLPRPEFFIIGDDTDYSIRISKLSNILFIPTAEIIRVMPLTTASELNWKDYYYLRNLIYLDKLHANKLVYWIRPLVFTLWKIYTEGIRKKSYRNIKIILKSFIHGIKGKMGKTVTPGSI